MSPAVADSNALVGQCIAERYELEACIGRGPTGATYRARHVESKQIVVVKVFADDVSEDPERQRQFELETSALSGLAHPNTPAILGFGVHYGHCFVAREWLEGETLAKRLAQGPLELEAAMRISRQLLAALAAAHATGLLHRNLHPGNVFLEARALGEKVRLLDFAALPASNATHFTPPERGTGELDARADVFAVGALVTAMLQRASGPNLRPVHVGSASAAQPASSEAHAGQSALASAAVVAVLSTASPGNAAAPPSAATAVATMGVRERESTSRRRAADSDEARDFSPLVDASAGEAVADGDVTTPRFGTTLVSAFDSDVPQRNEVAPLEPSVAPAPEETPLQRWIARATSREPDERFDDAADMFRELVDGPPRDLFDRAARSFAANPATDGRPQPKPRTHPLISPDASAENDAEGDSVVATFDSADRAAAGSATGTGTGTGKKSGPVSLLAAAASSIPTLLPEASPIALHTTVEPGTSQLTAATAFGAFAFAALVILVMPGEFGRAEKPSIIRARAAAPAADATRPGAPAAATAPVAPAVPEILAPVPLSAVAAIPAPPPKPVPYVAPAPVVARSKPGKVLPPARDPWKDAVPKDLQRFRASAWSGSKGDKGTLEALRIYNHEHADDARGYLITARMYLNRMWRTDGVAQYAAAFERDPTVRGAPEMLPALLECVAQGKGSEAAEALVQKAYGTGATPSIDHAIDGAKTQAAAVRLSTLNEKLIALSP